jgi:hypothetical protein
MKIRLLLVTLSAAVLSLPVARAQDAKEDQTELGSHMEKIGGAFRKLRGEVKDATKNEDSLKQIAIMKEHAEAALKLDPAKKADLPPEKQAKFVEDYRAKLKATIADMSKVEAALKAGKNEEAEQLLTTLKQDQKEGHEAFQKKKAKKG